MHARSLGFVKVLTDWITHFRRRSAPSVPIGALMVGVIALHERVASVALLGCSSGLTPSSSAACDRAGGPTAIASTAEDELLRAGSAA